jgi:hypothetical protein
VAECIRAAAEWAAESVLREALAQVDEVELRSAGGVPEQARRERVRSVPARPEQVRPEAEQAPVDRPVGLVSLQIWD